ncbi:hypothetical protein O181_049530 [Austropuccinia psidii MF-1]|uniref:Uncharacterized protein n=1 Tax=Austropuccinia psidii MF-1 TaxID=1389203 RepID=A0A9Q3HQ52_9BASI|nr:hypothetical protein [Austropuccinia psidii MF-1]
MTTRRGLKYSIQSDGAGLRGRIDFTKGKERAKSPVEQNPHKEAPYPKGKSQQCPYYLNQIQRVLHSVQGQRLGNVATNPPKSDELLAHPERIPQRGGNHEILQWMESTIIQPQIKNIKEYHAKKREASKEEAPVDSTSKPQANQLPQEGENKKKKNWRKTCSPSYRIPKIQKDSMENVCNMARTLI